jgi:hypothetical protein
MTGYDDEILMRRIDGELSPEDARRLDAAAAAHPEVANRLEAMRTLRAAAQGAFPLTADARDQELARLIRAPWPPRVSPWARAAGLISDGFTLKGTPGWIGLVTAAFVGGILAGPFLNPGDDGVALTSRGEIADSDLIRVLDRRLASDGPDGRGRAVGLTFRNTEGQWCRTFRSGEVGMAGLACRVGDGWELRGLAPDRPGSGEVRTASAETPLAILSLVDATVSGDTLDLHAEIRARDGGWR